MGRVIEIFRERGNDVPTNVFVSAAVQVTVGEERTEGYGRRPRLSLSALQLKGQWRGPTLHPFGWSLLRSRVPLRGRHNQGGVWCRDLRIHRLREGVSQCEGEKNEGVGDDGGGGQGKKDDGS